MRRDIMVFSAALVCAPICASNAYAGAEKTIVLNGSETCAPVTQTITVPVKMIGDKFEIVEFTPGNNCTNGNPLKKSGFDLYYNACPAPKGEGDLYWHNKAEATEKTSGKIGDVGVGEGDYCLKFDGGKGGVLKIKYMEE